MMTNTRRRQQQQPPSKEEERLLVVSGSSSSSDSSFPSTATTALLHHHGDGDGDVGPTTRKVAKMKICGSSLITMVLLVGQMMIMTTMMTMEQRQNSRSLIMEQQQQEEHGGTIPQQYFHVAERQQQPHQQQRQQEQQHPQKSEEQEDLTHKKYYELKDILPKQLRPSGRRGQKRNSFSAYSQATVVWNDMSTTSTTTTSSWFRKRKQCKETCCVETVAISLDQDDHKLINGEDGRDLADVMVEDWNPNKTLARPNHLKYFGSRYLPPEMIPCLLPGTIIFVQNDYHSLRQFWNTVRPQIRVPYILVVAGTDGETPGAVSSRFINKDPLLIKIFGTNPKYPNITPLRQQTLPKYQSIPLGLSRQHGQEKQLLPYMKLTNYTNPFWDFQERFNLTKNPLQFDKDVFVHFGLNRNHRRHIWKVACTPPPPQGNKTTTTTSRRAPIGSSTSCNPNTRTLSLHQIYNGMSQYRFGLSPTGLGYDCYRTYELLLMGVIPIVEKRDLGESDDLFQGLPVIQMSNMRQVTNQQEFITAIEDYITTNKEFQKNAATNFEEGWKRLFLSYNRQQILKAAGRTKEILVDETTGRQYYQAYHYTVVPNNESEKVDFFCPTNEPSCRYIDESWVKNPNPSLSEAQQKWLTDWENTDFSGTTKATIEQ